MFGWSALTMNNASCLKAVFSFCRGKKLQSPDSTSVPFGVFTNKQVQCFSTWNRGGTVWWPLECIIRITSQQHCRCSNTLTKRKTIFRTTYQHLGWIPWILQCLHRTFPSVSSVSVVSCCVSMVTLPKSKNNSPFTLHLATCCHDCIPIVLHCSAKNGRACFASKWPQNYLTVS